jgi:hypothetical protein
LSSTLKGKRKSGFGILVHAASVIKARPDDIISQETPPGSFAYYASPSATGRYSNADKRGAIFIGV